MEADLEICTDKEIDDSKILDNVVNDSDKDGYVDELSSTNAMEIVEIESPPPAESSIPCYPEISKAEMGNLLPPDHPLLQRFQQSLKEHLLRIKNQLADEINDIKYKIKLKEDERQEYGVKLYDMQHQIEKQNEVLEEYSINIHETVTKRIENEKLRVSLKNEYDAKLAITKQQKLNYNQRVVELNHLQNLENNIRSWTNEFETELTSSKRVVKKDAQLQKAIAEEKQKSDLMSYNLQVEVQKREEELAGLTQQISEQKEQNSILQSGLSDANADLEVLQQEHKRLNQSWGEVIVAIQHRDKVLFQAKETLNKQKEFLKLTYSSIEATKKQTAKETDQNVKLEAFKTRLAGDLLNLKKETDKQSKILGKLEMKMEELPTILEQTEKDYQESKKEGHQLGVQLNILQSKLDRQYSTKTKLEETILKIAQDQLLCDKASQYRFKILNERQQQRRTMEANMHKVQIQLNDMLMSLERQKTSILNLHEESERLSAILKNLNDEADGLSVEIKETEKQIAFKLKLIDKLSKELDELIKAAEGCEVSPTEKKIKTLERTIHEIDEEICKLQQFWVNLQEHIIHLSKRRNNQLSDIQMTRKQLMIMNQKSLKIDNDVEKMESSSREITREIQKFATKLELLSAKVYEKRKQHETAEFDCELAHFELLQKLRDSEMKVLQVEQETIDLQYDIEHHKELVLEAHRESLSWETKYKLIDETLRWRSNEKATESEIGNMKAEIHRMQIRYKELKRAQEKLILDLDHCVMHRERIFVVASTKQKMEGAHFRSRTNIQQRINDLKSKLKQVNVEITAAEKKLSELSKELGALEKTKSKVQRDVDDELYQDKLIASEIEQGILLKHQNLDSIVRKQNRAKEYRRLSAASTQPRLSKSEATIEFNMQKQSEINQNLTEIVESLISEFPEKKFLLMRLLQTLKD